MTLVAVLGAALTLLSLGLLLAGGYLLAWRLLAAAEVAGDTLALAIATLLGATAQAVAIALLLGALGHLYLPWALLVQLCLVVALLRWPRRLEGAELSAPLVRLLERARLRVGEHVALAVLTITAIGSEALRGLLRPPLSWDSLMYHLLLAASWLRSGQLHVVLGQHPINYYGYVPANGSLWLWWVLAPSHSELYVNLAFLPQCLLLGLAAGGIARQLGARQSWPIASFLIVLTPTVARFAATQYVDIFLGSCLLGAVFFGLSWLREPRAGSAALAGLGLGVAAGAKVLGMPYGLLLAVALAVLAPGWRARRVAHALLAAVLVAALGSYFYLRNIALGAGPLALACASYGAPETVVGGVVPLLPRPRSLLAPGGPPDIGRQALDTFLGITHPAAMEMGVGPPAFLLLLLVPLLPFALPRDRRREAWVVTIQVAGELFLWLTLPDVRGGEIFANVRYLIPALAILGAGGVAIAERRGLPLLGLEALALAVAAQDLLQLHAEMPPGVRLAVGALDLAAVALLFSPPLRRLLRRNAALVAAVLVVLALASAPTLSRFRLADRGRALATEWTVHSTLAKLSAPAWNWLDAHAGAGTVAIAGEPSTYFVYPAMGPYFERQALYVNINAANLTPAGRYPGCEPRRDPSPAAWLANLRRVETRWLLVSHLPNRSWPQERTWAQSVPALFALRYANDDNEIYELAPTLPAPNGSPRPAPS